MQQLYFAQKLDNSPQQWLTQKSNEELEWLVNGRCSTECGCCWEEIESVMLFPLHKKCRYCVINTMLSTPNF